MRSQYTSRIEPVGKRQHYPLPIRCGACVTKNEAVSPRITTNKRHDGVDTGADTACIWTEMVTIAMDCARFMDIPTAHGASRSYQDAVNQRAQNPWNRPPSQAPPARLLPRPCVRHLLVFTARSQAPLENPHYLHDEIGNTDHLF